MGGDTLIRIAKILRSHGLQGELRVAPYNDHIHELNPGCELTLESRFGKRRAVHLKSWRIAAGTAIAGFDEIKDLESAEPWAGGFLLIDKLNLEPLPKGEYYIDDLIGLEVSDTSGNVLGKLTDVFSMAATDVYEVTVNGRKHLIPSRGDIVESIDLEKGRVTIRVLPGLLE